MKKTIGTLLVAVSTIALASSASAMETEFKPYVGMDFAHTRMSSHSPYFQSPAINTGVMFNKYMGTELFAQHAAEFYQNSGYKASLQGYGLDVMGYLPVSVGCHEDLNLIGSIGMGEYRLTYKGSDLQKTRDTGYGYRLGAGALYKLTDNVALRAMYRRIQADKLDGIDHFNEFAVGVRYSF